MAEWSMAVVWKTDLVDSTNSRIPS